MVKKAQVAAAIAEMEAAEAQNDTAPETVPEVETPESAPAENDKKDDVNEEESAKKEDPKKETTKNDTPSEKKSKPVKKVVPAWASLSDEARAKLPASKLPKPKIQDAIIAAINQAGPESKGVVSVGTIKRLVMEDNPDLPKSILKKSILKALERGVIKQVKGKGFSGSFKLDTTKKPEKKAAGKDKKKKAAATSVGKEPLDNLFPIVFTWACNPKEASVGLIRKYIAKHYPELDVEGIKFKKALETAETKGQLERITGKGFSGTFQLVDEAKKTGGNYEDAIENAVIAMNEPKDVSVPGLRDYLGVYHPEYDTDQKPHVLKNALERAVKKGWLDQVTGKGFSGTYRLMHPFHPSPRELWGKDYIDPKKEEPKKKEDSKSKPKATKRAVSESEDESEDEDDEVVPAPKKRGAPKPRKTAAAPAKKVKKAAPAAKKAKPAGLKKTKPTPKKVKSRK